VSAAAARACAIAALAAACWTEPPGIDPASDPSFLAAQLAAQDLRWEDAYAHMGAALGRAERTPWTSTERLGEYHYHYGRYAGLTCRFDEAERELGLAHDYLERAKGPRYTATLELAELAFGRKRYPLAVDRFKRALAEMGADEPLSETLALSLDDYAVALDETGDRAGAVAVREHVYAWRKARTSPPESVPRPPYGRDCPEASARL